MLFFTVVSLVHATKTNHYNCKLDQRESTFLGPCVVVLCSSCEVGCVLSTTMQNKRTDNENRKAVEDKSTSEQWRSTCTQQDQRGRPRIRAVNTCGNNMQSHVRLERTNSFMKQSNNEAAESFCHNRIMERMTPVPEQTSQADASLKLSFQESEEDGMKRSLNLVRVSTTASTASTEIVSNTSPSSPYPNKHQADKMSILDLRRSSLQIGTNESMSDLPSGPHSTTRRRTPTISENNVTLTRSPLGESQRTAHPPSTPIINGQGTISLARHESPGDTRLIMREVELDPEFLDERSTSSDSHCHHPVIEFPANNPEDFGSERNSTRPFYRGSAEGRSHVFTDDYIRDQRIRRNVKVIGKILKAPSEDEMEADVVSCSEGKIEANIVDLTMYEETPVIMCSKSTDSGDSVPFHETQRPSDDNYWTANLGNTTIHTAKPRNNDLNIKETQSAAGATLPSTSNASEKLSKEESKQTPPKSVVKKPRQMLSKMSDNAPMDCSARFVVPKYTSQKNDSVKTKPNRYGTNWSPNSAAAFFSTALDISKIAPPVTDVWIRPSPIPRGGLSGSDREDNIEISKTTHQSSIPPSFPSNINPGEESDLEDKHDTNLDRISSLPPERKHFDKVRTETNDSTCSEFQFHKLWTGTPSISEKASSYLEKISSAQSPLSSVIPLMPDSMEYVENKVCADEENPSIDERAPSNPAQKQLRKIRVKTKPTLSCWANSWLLYCLLLLMGSACLILAGLDLAGSKTLDTLRGRRDGEAETKPNLDPAPQSSIQSDIFVGVDFTITPQPTNSPITIAPTTINSDPIPKAANPPKKLWGRDYNSEKGNV